MADCVVAKDRLVEHKLQHAHRHAQCITQLTMKILPYAPTCIYIHCTFTMYSTCTCRVYVYILYMGNAVNYEYIVCIHCISTVT